MYQLNVRSPHQTAAYLAMTLKKDVIYFQVSQNEGLIAPENPLTKILGKELIQSAWSYGSSFAIIAIPDVEQFIQDIAKCLKVEDNQESQHTTQIILFLGKNNHKVTPQNLKSVYIYIDPFHNANIDVTDNLQELEEIVG